MSAAAIALAVAVALRVAEAVSRATGRLLVRHLRWYWTLPTITSKVVVAALDSLALVVLDHLLPLPSLLRAVVVTIAATALATVFLGAILFHSPSRRQP